MRPASYVKNKHSEEAREYLKTLGKSIQMLRKLNGMTAFELSKRTYISRQHLSRLECGHHLPDLVTLGMIAKELNATVALVFDITKIDKQNKLKDGTIDKELFGQ